MSKIKEMWSNLTKRGKIVVSALGIILILIIKNFDKWKTCENVKIKTIIFEIAFAFFRNLTGPSNFYFYLAQDII